MRILEEFWHGNIEPKRVRAKTDPIPSAPAMQKTMTATSSF